MVVHRRGAWLTPSGFWAQLATIRPFSVARARPLVSDAARDFENLHRCPKVVELDCIHRFRHDIRRYAVRPNMHGLELVLFHTLPYQVKSVLNVLGLAVRSWFLGQED